MATARPGEEVKGLNVEQHDGGQKGRNVRKETDSQPANQPICKYFCFFFFFVFWF
jgi:hypothetical protein